MKKDPGGEGVRKKLCEGRVKREIVLGECKKRKL